MLGVLIEGSESGSFQNTMIFRPMETIFSFLKIRECSKRN